MIIGAICVCYLILGLLIAALCARLFGWNDEVHLGAAVLLWPGLFTMGVLILGTHAILSAIIMLGCAVKAVTEISGGRGRRG